MLELIIKRCLASIPLLIGLSLFTFCLLRAIPGDPIEVFLGGSEKELSTTEKALLRQELGLDKSLPEQYIGWLKEITKGNLGNSYRDGRPVSELIAERLPPTLCLVSCALLLAVIFGSVGGIAMVYFSQSTKYLAPLISALAYLLYSTPSFYLGFLLIAAAAALGLNNLHLLGMHQPGLSGIEIASLFLPALVLSSRRAAKLALILESSMLAELNQNYVLLAYAKGVSIWDLLIKHIGKNSLLPVISFIGLSLPALIGGSVLVETVFAWPGMGRLAVDATFARDYPTLLALTIIYGSAVILANLLADLVQIIIDPRLQDQGSSSALFSKNKSTIVA